MRVLAVLLLLHVGDLAHAMPTVVCGGGRFVLPQPVAIGGRSGQLRVDAITIQTGVSGSGVADIGCGPAPATMQRTRAGIVVRARWPLCGRVRRVRLRANLGSPGCRGIGGTLRARNGRATRFEAIGSRCGDGIVDPVTGEACEPSGEACDSGIPCTPTCTCGVAVTTSTTLPPLRAGVCSDGVHDAGEACDGNDLGRAQCQSLTFPVDRRAGSGGSLPGCERRV